MTKIRTIEQAIALIRSEDQDSSLTKHALRQLIINQRIPSVRVGSKYLINMEVLETFLKGDIPPQDNNTGIRRLNEKLG